MRNLVLNPDCVKKNRVVVDGDLYHYLKDVRRIREGNRIDAMIGERHYSLVVSSIQKSKIVFGIDHERDIRNRRNHISVYQGLLKSKKMDLVVSKLGEIGVGDFFPLKTQRSLPQINLEGERLARWRRLAREGAKVSGIEGVMTVHDPARFADLIRNIERAEDASILLFSTKGAGEHLPHFLRSLDAGGTASFHLIFGPEGGFTDEEIRTVIEKGGVPITMGDYIMKAETASIIGAGFIRIYYSDRHGP
jgi:16S rRNA (uracil1498-N3)-methyltransferase